MDADAILEDFSQSEEVQNIGPDLDVDYAQLQIAFCYGYMGETNKKISALNDFTQVNLKSTLRDDAFYELGNSYVKLNQTDQAMTAYDEVVNNYSMSSLVSKSLLKQGLVYFNADNACGLRKITRGFFVQCHGHKIYPYWQCRRTTVFIASQLRVIIKANPSSCH